MGNILSDIKEIEPTLSADGKTLSVRLGESGAKRTYDVQSFLDSKYWYEKNAILAKPSIVWPVSTFLFSGVFLAAKVLEEVMDQNTISFKSAAVCGASVDAIVGIATTFCFKEMKEENNEILNKVRAARNSL